MLDPYISDDLSSSIWSILHLFLQNVEDGPNKLAVEDQDVSLSYIQLNKQANIIANKLIEKIEPGKFQDPILILLPPGSAFVCACLGVLKSGGFYLPIDIETPIERIRELIESSQSGTIISSYPIISEIGLEYSESNYLNIDILGRCGILSQSHNDEDPSVYINGYNIAYIIYTSGSTGKPKGVVQTHAHVVHNVRNHQENFDIRHSDRQSMIYPVHVYGSSRDMFNALLSGASLHIFSDLKKHSNNIPGWIFDKKITIWCSIVSLFRYLGPDLYNWNLFPELRILKLGGEAVPPDAISLYRDNFNSNCRLSCGFASTEIGAITQYMIDHHVSISNENATMGFPLKGKEIILIDEDGKEVKDDKIGQLIVKSKFISPGYWDDIQKNRNKIINDLSGNKKIFFKTGDMARWNKNGSLVHCGRLDDLVKIRGFRVDIHDINIKLSSQPGISQSAVAIRRDHNNEIQIIGYIVPKDNSELDPFLVRKKLQNNLPDYMIPSFVVVLEKLPLTSNGKLDRASLPVPDIKSIGARPPISQTEKIFCGIFSHILNTEVASVDDDFFSLGGNSLLVIRLVNSIKDKFNIEVPIESIFDNSTVSGLIKYIFNNQDNLY